MDLDVGIGRNKICVFTYENTGDMYLLRDHELVQPVIGFFSDRLGQEISLVFSAKSNFPVQDSRNIELFNLLFNLEESMKIVINFTSIILFSFSIIACNADSNKNSATKSNSKEISFLLGDEYTREYSASDASSVVNANSSITFSDQTKFEIQSWFYANLDKEGLSGIPSQMSSCKIEGEVTELANGLLLLTQIESNSDEKKDNVRVEMTLKLIDDKTLELSLIQPSSITDVCRDGMGSNGGHAIVGEYTKGTFIQNQDSSSEWYLHLRNLTWEQTKEKFLSEVGRWVRRWNQAGKIGGWGPSSQKWQGGGVLA